MNIKITTLWLLARLLRSSAETKSGGFESSGAWQRPAEACLGLGSKPRDLNPKAYI